MNKVEKMMRDAARDAGVANHRDAFDLAEAILEKAATHEATCRKGCAGLDLASPVARCAAGRLILKAVRAADRYMEAE